MRAARRALALALAGTAMLATLSACASTDPDVERRKALIAVVEAANTQDADALREAVNDLIALINRQSGESLGPAEADRIREDAVEVKDAADLIDPEIARRRAQASATPSPTPTPSSTPTPSPTPSPTPTNDPTPTPTPTGEPSSTVEATPTAQSGDDGDARATLGAAVKTSARPSP